MTLEQFRSYCLSKPGSVEDFPFGDDVIVFKVGGKIFALSGVDPFESVNLKCDPERAQELREAYPSVLPGYHMNKKHWNTILMDRTIPLKTIYDWIDHSYSLVSVKNNKSIK